MFVQLNFSWAKRSLSNRIVDSRTFDCMSSLFSKLLMLVENINPILFIALALLVLRLSSSTAKLDCRRNALLWMAMILEQSRGCPMLLSTDYENTCCCPVHHVLLTGISREFPHFLRKDCDLHLPISWIIESTFLVSFINITKEILNVWVPTLEIGPPCHPLPLDNCLPQISNYWPILNSFQLTLNITVFRWLKKCAPW